MNRMHWFYPMVLGSMVLTLILSWILAETVVSSAVSKMLIVAFVGLFATPATLVGVHYWSHEHEDYYTGD